jgi:serine/threonine protein kinase/tetratricopeptide (TPR) repeat protein
MSVPANDVKSIFGCALELSDPAERAAYLASACGDNMALRAEVDGLLAALDRAGGFLKNLPVAADGPGAPLSEAAMTLTVGPKPEPTADYPGRDEHAGAVIGGRYTLVEVIGEGGMGSVWRARQTEPVKRSVAVKLIKAGMDSKQVLARFEAERQALALMDHPNIAKVLDGGIHGGRPFFVMELVKGVPITQYCDANKLTPKQRLELFVQACLAIQHAHQKGIIHRDIKPSNVLVALYDDKPVVKVIDFGVAKATGGTLTEATIDTGFGGVVGTPQYMSPEQATFNNLDIDTRSDVYSLGVLLYELLVGSPPFANAELKKRGLLEMLRVVREEEPPKPSTKLSTADALPSLAANRGTEPKKLTGLLRNELDWIVMKALEKDRTRRYETANGFAADVQRYLAGEAVQAHPPSTAYRLKKFVRKNRVPVAAGLLLFLALALGTAGTTFGLIRAEQAMDRESSQRCRAEKAYARTADVLDTMVSGVTGNSLSTQKAITPEQKKFLTQVVTYYREFAAEKGGGEPTRRRTARAAFRVGVIEYRLGRKAEAAAGFRFARDEFEHLVNTSSDATSYRLALARSLGNLGAVEDDLQRLADAEGHFRAALHHLGHLVAEQPGLREHQQELSKVHNNLGLLLRRQRKWAEAEAALQASATCLLLPGNRLPADPDERRSIAIAHYNLGGIYRDQGKWKEAESAHREALAIQEQLLQAAPRHPDYRDDVAKSLTGLGNVQFDQGQVASAEQYKRRAIEIEGKLVAEFPSVPSYRKLLANSHYGHGRSLEAMGQVNRAEGHYREAIQVLEAITVEALAEPDYQNMMAICHNQLGSLLTVNSRHAEAETELRRAAEIWRTLGDEFPGNIEYAVSRAGVHCNLGMVVRERAGAEASLEWLNSGITTLRPIAEAYPKYSLARLFLRNTCEERAISYDHLKRPADAFRDWDEAVRLSPPAEQTAYRTLRARSRVLGGRVAEGLAEVDELAQAGRHGPDRWYEFARVYAAAAGAASGKLAEMKTGYADRAMEMLQRAVKAGYKDVKQLRTDKDLDPLRDRDDFKKLLAELESKCSLKTETTPAPKEKK